MKKIHSFDEVFDSQKLFRLILSALSNPLKTVNIKEFADKLFGNNSDFLAVAMVLLDNEVSFNTCENRELSDEMLSLTLSKRETISNADYIFVEDPNNLKEVIENAKCGTLIDPHKSATVIVKIPGDKNSKLTLIGAGIDVKVCVYTSEVVLNVLTLRDSRFFEYPEGIDLFFIDDSFNLFAIPRLTRLEV
ncbi:phosphonate C-P lyase system protein PhnH [Acetivibrio cellulolyticus]|uniref:phosphonate C-P lyase system protein PhnH n=1 Tax=Acetivibrio cellulolyticus TaxID=35830 RepID=UPI0001E2CBC1|nr:phosphonate C-P lyase system protein PhnH [Acetivibrio cellulolyticus]